MRIDIELNDCSIDQRKNCKGEIPNSLILKKFGEVEYCYRIEAMTTMKRRHPDGIAIEAEQIIKNSNGSLGDTTSSESVDHLFITMCFYARLGFVQPPSCLKCAHRKSTKKGNERNANNSGTSSCNNLVPWRRDANKPLHPDGLGDNLVFVTCETAKSLINGEVYPSIQWDNNNRRILHEM